MDNSKGTKEKIIKLLADIDNESDLQRVYELLKYIYTKKGSDK